jgi:hypothetical protein
VRRPALPPASLDHADVHPNNIFAATGMPFDWGDAALAHPFASLLVLLRTAAEQAGLPAGAPEFTALTEAYLRPWHEAGHPREAITRALPLALRIAPLARALTWGRLFPATSASPGRPPTYASKQQFIDEVLAPFGARLTASEPFRPVTRR